MQNLSSLKELTQKLDEIKEVWQIYAIFEEARKSFNEEFDALKKDKEALIESYNDISAKNALLLAQNKELEEKNKILMQNNAALENTKNISMESDTTLKENIETLKTKNFSSIYMQCENLQEILKAAQKIFKDIPNTPLEPVSKLEVSYQKHQRLLANPARDYIALKDAQKLLNMLISTESKLKTLDLEFAKLHIEIRDLLKDAQSQDSEIKDQEASELDSIILESDTIKNSDSINNEKP